nr:hypothetical protein [Tanacetum cinerariifolium]
MPTKIELTQEQSQQGVSNDVFVSIEGVEELKRNVQYLYCETVLMNRRLMQPRSKMNDKAMFSFSANCLNADSTALTRAGVGDGAGAEDWFFFSRSNALTISLSSATSDEMARVEELEFTLATTALARG